MKRFAISLCLLLALGSCDSSDDPNAQPDDDDTGHRSNDDDSECSDEGCGPFAAQHGVCGPNAVPDGDGCAALEGECDYWGDCSALLGPDGLKVTDKLHDDEVEEYFPFLQGIIGNPKDSAELEACLHFVFDLQDALGYWDCLQEALLEIEPFPPLYPEPACVDGGCEVRSVGFECESWEDCKIISVGGCGQMAVNADAPVEEINTGMKCIKMNPACGYCEEGFCRTVDLHRNETAQPDGSCPEELLEERQYGCESWDDCKLVAGACGESAFNIDYHPLYPYAPEPVCITFNHACGYCDEGRCQSRVIVDPQQERKDDGSCVENDDEDDIEPVSVELLSGDCGPNAIPDGDGCATLAAECEQPFDCATYIGPDGLKSIQREGDDLPEGYYRHDMSSWLGEFGPFSECVRRDNEWYEPPDPEFYWECIGDRLGLDDAMPLAAPVGTCEDNVCRYDPVTFACNDWSDCKMIWFGTCGQVAVSRETPINRYSGISCLWAPPACGYCADGLCRSHALIYRDDGVSLGEDGECVFE